MIAWLEVSTWRGLSIDAEHWFGHLRCDDRKISLDHPMSAHEAAQANRKQRTTLNKEGKATNAFTTEAALEKHAVTVFRNLFPGATLLIKSDNSLYPGPVLFGPPEVQQQASVLFDRMEALYAGRNEPRSWREHDAILDEWETLIAPYKSEG